MNCKPDRPSQNPLAVKSEPFRQDILDLSVDFGRDVVLHLFVNVGDRRSLVQNAQQLVHRTRNQADRETVIINYL